MLNGQAMDIPEDQREEEAPAIFKGIYTGGTWLVQDPASLAGASGSAQSPNQGQEQQAPQQGSGAGASGNGGAQ